MLFCAAGDSHGALDELYANILAFEKTLGEGARFSWVLHVGDFGVWPNPRRLDRATRRREGAGDFPAWCAERKGTPRKTLFIKGNHEDFVWLDEQPEREILPDLFYLPNGSRVPVRAPAPQPHDRREKDPPVWVGGMGGCYAPTDYDRSSAELHGFRKRHYTRDEIARLGGAGPVDILLFHEPPAGVVYESRKRGPAQISRARGLDELVRAKRPLVCLFGHHHTRCDATLDGVPCVGLAIVGRAGNLVAFEVDPVGGRFQIIAER